jgi:DoxX
MNAIYARMERFRPYILSILRIVIGLLFLQHGLSKVFNFPAPSPVPSLSGLLILAAILETVGAALFLVGAYTRIVAFILRARWPSPISWRMRRARSIRWSMPENWRSCSASYSSISPLREVAP